MYNSKIIAFENCLAEKIVTNDDLSKFVETSDEWITSRTGIKQRRISNGDNTSDICTKTALGLLEKAGISAEEIELLIVATITPDYLTPSTACIVQGKIGAKNSVAFDINAACSGFVYALSIAEKFIRSGVYKKAMVLGAETLSKIVDWNDRSTCVLFGDGAGGVILSQTDDDSNFILAEDIHSDGEGSDAITGGILPVKNLYVKEPEGLNYAFDMNGREVFNFATRKVPKSINTVLEKAGVDISEIKYIVPHQANIRIVEVVAKKLKLDMDRFYINIDKYGNTSAASIPLALSEMDKSGLLQKGDKVIITGFGAGLTWGSILLQI